MATAPRGTRPARARRRTVARAAPAGALGIAALDDEAGHDPVEGQAVVEAVAGVHHEVVDRVRRQLGIELEDDVAAVGGDGDLVDQVLVDLERRGRGHPPTLGDQP
jgi:hypothetical protein